MDVLRMNRPIQMIACTDMDGHITPMRFRMKEKEEIITFFVEKILLQNHRGPHLYDGYFVCKVTGEYGPKTVELRYHYATHRWYLEEVRDT